MDLYKGGILIYKCRRCGELNKDIHIPCGIDLDKIINEIPLDRENTYLHQL